MIEIASIDTLRACRAYSNELDPKQRFKIYARELRPRMQTEDGLQHVMLAANMLGTLSGTLLAQRALDLLKIEFPLLSRISTKFTEQRFKPDMVGRPGFNQTIATRLVSVPAVGTYSEELGYVSQNAETTDVAVTIDAHKFVQVDFNANEMSTVRKLLAEQETPLHYAIGKDLVDAIYALFTEENFPETPTIRALVDWDRSGVIAIGTAMQGGSAGRNANSGTRTLLLDSNYYGKLCEDETVVSNIHNRSADTISTGVLPMVAGYLPVDAPNITSGSRVGVGLRADAVALATALPEDYANQPGLPATALQEVVTNPDLNLSVHLTIFQDHKGGKTFMRLAWMRGQARGNQKSAQLLLNN